ncbi:hypothetical protein ACJ41P_32520 [Azospirillum argentinense]|uniref:Uncharacterized protein n=1 Tax=Azospirillum argentinense TaxID=2970906 RepID=A0ABW8VJP5_9PROT
MAVSPCQGNVLRRREDGIDGAEQRGLFLLNVQDEALDQLLPEMAEDRPAFLIEPLTQSQGTQPTTRKVRARPRRT